MVKPPGQVAPPGAAAHHEDPHRRLVAPAVVDAFDPAIEPAPPPIEEIHGEVAVHSRRRPEIDLASVAQRAVAVRPGPEHQPHRAALCPRQPGIVLHRGAGIRVVPARQVHHRHIGIGLVVALGVDAGLLPVIVEHAARPLLEQIVLVFRRGADRRVAPTPRHTAEPFGDVLRRQFRPRLRILGVGQRVAVSPGRLLQVEGAAVPDAAAIRVREAAAIEELRGEAGRVEAAERHLGVRRVGQAEGRDAAVAPGLPHQPSQRVIPILGLAQVFRERALGAIAAAAILVGDSVAVPNEIRRHPLARARLRIGGGDLGAARRRFVVGGALDNHRKPAGAVRAVDVGREQHPIARRDHQIALNHHRSGTGHFCCPPLAPVLPLRGVSATSCAPTCGKGA